MLSINKDSFKQRSLFDGQPSAEDWDKDITRRALDELFVMARRYNSSEAYMTLMRFVAGFRMYAPFNAMLVQIQMPGATYLAPAYRWARNYGRHIKPDARPLVILQPMGPVMFVFDVSDTEPVEDAPPLPPEIERPFEVKRGQIGSELSLTIENAKRDGVRITEHAEGASGAGMIYEIERVSKGNLTLDVLIKTKPEPEFVQVPLRYELLLNARHSPETEYATVVHELAHLYCGHLGVPDPKWNWWPNRGDLDKTVREFEAESVAYLLCGRLGIDNPSEEYLAHYVKDCDATPPISLECVMKAAGLIEQMGREHLKPRKVQDK